MANDIINVIEKLIGVCREGQAGYREAAQHTRNPELLIFFSHQTVERANFARELEIAARALGEADPSRNPSMANTMHRAWDDLKYKLGAGDASILESVESEEHHAGKHYHEALQARLPPDVFAIVERQADLVFAAHEQIRTLLNKYNSAA